VRIELTTDWPSEKIAQYGPDITAALHKLVGRFPHVWTMKSLSEDIFSGNAQLWLIMEGDEFRSFVLTEIKTTPATGHKSVILTGLAGEGGIDVCPLIADIERWAWSIGADEVCPVGRLGWKKGLAPLGYSADIIFYRKARPQ
jgi:hypothetical protein